MHTALMLAVVPLFPLGCLGFLLYLGWLEDRLDADMKKKVGRGPAPAPIRAIPVQAPATEAATVPALKPVPARSRSAVQVVEAGRLPAVS